MNNGSAAQSPSWISILFAFVLALGCSHTSNAYLCTWFISVSIDHRCACGGRGVCPSVWHSQMGCSGRTDNTRTQKRRWRPANGRRKRTRRYRSHFQFGSLWSRATFLLTPLVRKEKKKKNNGPTIKYIEWSDRRYGQESVLFIFQKEKPLVGLPIIPWQVHSARRFFYFLFYPSPADVFLCVVYLRVTSKLKFFFQLYVQR